jgi:hypothetical protein
MFQHEAILSPGITSRVPAHSIWVRGGESRKQWGRDGWKPPSSSSAPFSKVNAPAPSLHVGWLDSAPCRKKTYTCTAATSKARFCACHNAHAAGAAGRLPFASLYVALEQHRDYERERNIWAALDTLFIDGQVNNCLTQSRVCELNHYRCWYAQCICYSMCYQIVIIRLP